MSVKVGFEDKESIVPESRNLSLEDDSLFLRHDSVSNKRGKTWVNLGQNARRIQIC